MFHMEIQPLLSWVVGFKLDRLQPQVADVFEPVAFSLWMRWVWLAKLLKRESREENWTKENLSEQWSGSLNEGWPRDEIGRIKGWHMNGTFVELPIIYVPTRVYWNEMKNFCEIDPQTPHWGTKQEIFLIHLKGISVGLTPLKSREMKRSEQESTLTSRTWERETPW